MKEIVIDKDTKIKLGMVGNKTQTYDEIVRMIINYVKQNNIKVEVKKLKVNTRSSIILKEDTLKELDMIGKIGDSYNDIICAIIDVYIRDNHERSSN